MNYKYWLFKTIFLTARDKFDIKYHVKYQFENWVVEYKLYEILWLDNIF